mmetsp:Transcript_33118/g.92794  ORF Transcript_33118/g.92794 Transcript_33118/m.92794 type:complete len:224 (-) Transcript_33118:356-1027(-)
MVVGPGMTDVAAEHAEMVAGKTRCSIVREGTELVCGNTDVGYRRLCHEEIPRLMKGLNGVRDLRFVTADAEGVTMGAAVTISDAERWCDDCVGTRPRHATRFVSILCEQIRYFANRLVRNVRTLGGSLCAADALSDLYPVWLATDSYVLVVGSSGRDADGTTCRTSRSIPVRRFVSGPRQTALARGEVVRGYSPPGVRSTTVRGRTRSGAAGTTAKHWSPPPS